MVRFSDRGSGWFGNPRGHAKAGRGEKVYPNRHRIHREGMAKGSDAPIDPREVQSVRSPHAIAVDNALQAKKQYARQGPYGDWVQDPARSDVQGIDSLRIIDRPITPEPEKREPREPVKPPGELPKTELMVLMPGDGHDEVKSRQYLGSFTPAQAVKIDREAKRLYPDEAKSGVLKNTYVGRMLKRRKNVPAYATQTEVYDRDAKKFNRRSIIALKSDFAKVDKDPLSKVTFSHELSHVRKYNSPEERGQHEGLTDAEAHARVPTKDSHATLHRLGYYHGLVPRSFVWKEGAEREKGLEEYKQALAKLMDEDVHVITGGKGRVFRKSAILKANLLKHGKTLHGAKADSAYKIPHLTTSEGDKLNVMVIDPKKPVAWKSLARELDAYDGKVGEEKVFLVKGRKKKRLR